MLLSRVEHVEGYVYIYMPEHIYFGSIYLGF